MSGGSYNYCFGHIDSFASDMRNTDTDPMRASFKRLLELVATAMHDIEWVDSCDYGKGGEHEAIQKVFSFLEADPKLIAKAHAYDGLKQMLLRYFNERPEKLEVKE